MIEISESKAKELADGLNIDLTKYPIDLWLYALKVELEHGSVSPKTDVTHDDLVVTSKIALAHILEFPDYYTRLKKLENDAEEYWKDKKKPSILKRTTMSGSSYKKYLKYKLKYIKLKTSNQH
jgi:hypothetical protein